MYGDKIIKCFNCKQELTLREYNIAWGECNGNDSELKWCLCDGCKEEQRQHHDFIEDMLGDGE